MGCNRQNESSIDELGRELATFLTGLDAAERMGRHLGGSALMHASVEVDLSLTCRDGMHLNLSPFDAEDTFVAHTVRQSDGDVTNRVVEIGVDEPLEIFFAFGKVREGSATLTLDTKDNSQGERTRVVLSSLGELRKYKLLPSATS